MLLTEVINANTDEVPEDASEELIALHDMFKHSKRL